MTTVASGLTTEYRETVSFHPNGEYQTNATINAVNPTTRATMHLEWNGRWQFAEDKFVRDFIGIKAVSGERNGTPMTQNLLDDVAEAFRRSPQSESGKVLTLNAAQFVLETSTTPLNCKR